MSVCIAKVRTLEQSLEKEFDRDRRLHGWAREGMDMDRDDFIDLALVSKQVPGKTPAQARIAWQLLYVYTESQVTVARRAGGAGCLLNVGYDSCNRTDEAIVVVGGLPRFMLFFRRTAVRLNLRSHLA